MRLEEREMIREVFVREARADLANRLILFVLRVKYAEQEAAVAARPLALTQVSAHHDNVERVADALLKMNLHY